MKPKNEQEFNLIRREVGVFCRDTYADYEKSTFEGIAQVEENEDE